MITNTIDAGVTRVRFRERQLLRAVDLEDEQSYLITTRRRHNIGPHGWGILSGLELTRSPDGIVVEPGVAVDGYGRELIVPSPILIPPDAFNALKQKRLDVWLFYDLVEANVPQRGARDCGPGRNTRNRERASLRLTRAPVVSNSDGARASRTPAEVPFADLPFPPSRMSPDDPAREWPVYLGRIRRRKKRAIFRNAPRAYASLTGELVSAASGTARMQVGSELESDTRRFAVSVVDIAGKWNERVAVDREGNTVINGNTSIKSRAEEARPGEVDVVLAVASGGKIPTGRLRLRENKDPKAGVQPQAEPLCARSAGTASGDKPGSARMVHFESLAVEPLVVAPWSVYRTSTIQNKSVVKQLRFEIGHPGDKGDPTLSKLVVGMRRGLANLFLPSLTVSADCNVTIEGDLEVLGELSQGPITPDPADPDFSALIANQWAEGTVVAQVTVAPGTMLISVVRASSGAPIPGATVDIENVQRSLRRNGITDPAGKIAFSNLPAGRYNIRIVAQGFVTVRKNDVEVAEGGTASIAIEMTVPGTISGSLVDSTNAAVAGALVVIDNLDTGESGSRDTDEDGRFILLGMPPGRYRATTNAVGLVFQEGDLAPGGTLVFTLRP